MKLFFLERWGCVVRCKASWKIENIWRPFPLYQLVTAASWELDFREIKGFIQRSSKSIVKLLFKELGLMRFPDLGRWKYHLRSSPFGSWRHRAGSEGLEKSGKKRVNKLFCWEKEWWFQISELDCPWREMVKHSLATPWTSIFSNQPLPSHNSFFLGIQWQNWKCWY